MTAIHEATPAELEAWDRRTVDAPGGHVYQSRGWAEHRARFGWQARHLVFEDGHASLALVRRWPLVGGAGAYLPRGPISAGEPPERTAERLVAIAAWLAGRGVDVVASDAEIGAASGYPARIRAAGFRPIPEIQPSRHRLSLRLAPGADDDAVRAGFGKSTRQRIRAADGGPLVVARYDRGGAAVDEALFGPPARPLAEALDEFYTLLEATGERRGFRFGPRSAFVPWWELAHGRGQLVFLEARAADAAIGGLILYRHGARLSTVHSADRPGARDEHPGVMHLLRWRAIQLALRERREEMDLGGVDVGPDYREPVEGMPMYGLYEHKRSFGAVWVEMSGAHELVVRPWRYAIGRAAGRVVRLAGR